MAIDKIISASITDGTIATADIADGAVTSVKTTGVGGNMKPAFQAYMSGNLSASNDTYTKLQVNTEEFDTDGAYDHSTNYRFTPQTSGKYFIYGSTRVDPGTGNLTRLSISIYKNGSEVKQTDFFLNASSQDMSLLHTNTIGTVSLNGSSDYVELYARLRTYNGSGIECKGGINQTIFGGYKIIT